MNGHIPRARLLAQLRRGAQRRLTLIVAPTGYGKTALVEDWAALHDGSPVARIEFRSAEGQERAVARLVEVVDAVSGHHDAVLALDGIDAVGSPALIDEIGAAVDHMPSDVHVMLTSRSRLPVESFVGRRGVVLVDERQLAFTRAEVGRLVHAVSSVALDRDHLDRLFAATEGWPVAVQLAAIGMRHASDPGA